MSANDVRLDLLHVWLDCGVRERVVDERVYIWFQDVVTRCGNGVADRGVGTPVEVFTDEEGIHRKPRKGYFEDQVDKTSENTLLGLLFRGRGLAMHDWRDAGNLHLQETISAAI